MRFKKRIKPWFYGEELQAYLQEIQTSMSLPSTGHDITLPDYKFYTKLLVKILNQSRLFGATYKSILWDWREGIQRDIQYDKNIYQQLMGGIFQFALLSLMTWLFMMLSSFIASINLSIKCFVLIIALQSMGFISWRILFYFFEKKFLSGFADFFFTLYTLKSLGGIGLSTAVVVNSAQLEKLESSPKYLSLLKIRVYEVCRLYQQKGHSLGKENELLIQELWFLRLEQLEKLKKTLEHGKLALIILFFLPSYFVFIYELISSLSLGI